MKTDLKANNLVEITNSFSTIDPGTENHITGKSLVYNEMSDVPVSSRTEFELLNENMTILKDMSDRLTFMSKEIRYLLNLK